MKRRKYKKQRHYAGDARPGFKNLRACLAEHAPPGYKCFINSEWGDEDTSRMSFSCGYDDFKIVPGHYDFVEGDAIFDEGVGCMLFVPEGILGDSMVDYS